MNDMCTFLIAEDDPDDQLLFQEAFEQASPHTRIEFANDGIEALDALERLQTFEPDAVLMDLNMPRRNGLETLRDIRASSVRGELPVVMVTTSGEQRDRERCLAAGANDYIRKPASFDEMISLAASLVSQWCPDEQPAH